MYEALSRIGAGVQAADVHATWYKSLFCAVVFCHRPSQQVLNRGEKKVVLKKKSSVSGEVRTRREAPPWRQVALENWQTGKSGVYAALI